LDTEKPHAQLIGGHVELSSIIEDATAGLGSVRTREVHDMTSATIKLFLPLGDAKSLRTAEISNWTGKAVAAPRIELDELLAREELDKAGVYILTRHSRNQTGKSVTMPEWASNY
jgi:hypothetical protein